MNNLLLNTKPTNLSWPITLMFYLVLNTALAQTYTEADTSQKIEESQEVNPQILASIGVEVSTDIDFENIRGNSIFLKQIGEYNTATVITNTTNSEIHLLQNGSNNETKLNYNSRTAYADISQIGNDNLVIDQFSAPGFDVSLELQQNGDNLNFVRDGVNELTKSLRFTQTNASPSLIVRSLF